MNSISTTRKAQSPSLATSRNSATSRG
ncbi:hypothetical protein LINGRAHAP2_LOCUS33197 [Linum grandiflorum]